MATTTEPTQSIPQMLVEPLVLILHNLEEDCGRPSLPEGNNTLIPTLWQKTKDLISQAQSELELSPSLSQSFIKKLELCQQAAEEMLYTLQAYLPLDPCLNQRSKKEIEQAIDDLHAYLFWIGENKKNPKPWSVKKATFL